jgi:hypothetical protein
MAELSFGMPLRLANGCADIFDSGNVIGELTSTVIFKGCAFRRLVIFNRSRTNTMKYKAMFAAALLSASFLAPAGNANAASCEENFSVEGSFFKGKQFKTWTELSGVSYDSAFRKVAQAVAAGGFGAVTSDKDTGIITAGQAVTMGNGSVAPLNIIVQEKTGGLIHIEANFSISGGQAASADTAKSELCRIATAPAS